MPSEFFQTISPTFGIKQLYVCACESKRVGWKQVSNVVENFELTSEQQMVYSARGPQSYNLIHALILFIPSLAIIHGKTLAVALH